VWNHYHVIMVTVKQSFNSRCRKILVFILVPFLINVKTLTYSKSKVEMNLKKKSNLSEATKFWSVF